MSLPILGSLCKVNLWLDPKENSTTVRHYVKIKEVDKSYKITSVFAYIILCIYKCIYKCTYSHHSHAMFTNRSTLDPRFQLSKNTKIISKALSSNYGDAFPSFMFGKIANEPLIAALATQFFCFRLLTLEAPGSTKCVFTILCGWRLRS